MTELNKKTITPIAVDYNLGSINGFDRVNIGMKNNKFLISYFHEKNTLFETIDAIIGGVGFLTNEKELYANLLL